MLILGSTQTVDRARGRRDSGKRHGVGGGTTGGSDLVAAGGNVASREILELPSPTRNFISFVAMLPGVQLNPSAEGSDSISVNGQSSTR